MFRCDTLERPLRDIGIASSKNCKGSAPAVRSPTSTGRYAALSGRPPDDADRLASPQAPKTQFGQNLSVANVG